MTWRGSTTVRDRIFASLPYLLPLFSALPFGVFIFQQFPALAAILVLLLTPVTLIYRIVPFPDLVIFFLLFLLVVRNEKIQHFIRFNTMQALLLDILIFLCSLLWKYMLQPLGFNLVTQTLLALVFLAALAACIYSVVKSLQGHYAEIPSLSEAAYAQVR
ncbi:Tic20 family protein [Allocoleopsis sp.]|uniref:Tic20 family protein n=1 Tax=Allocoleopsis sp. TaxID=3088169 RepID=UPI002FD70C0D